MSQAVIYLKMRLAAFFYCEVDGSSLCLQCDMVVHVGRKRTHGRYLLLRQRIEFPENKPGRLRELGLQPLCPNEVRKDQNQQPKLVARKNQQNHRLSPVPVLDDGNADGDGNVGNKLIDLNAKPQWMHGQASTNREQAMDVSSANNHDSVSVVPVGSFKREPEK